jgi:hypothetical protein
MRPNGIGLPENLLFPDDPSRPDLEALRMAKARQDVSHQRLDRWIADTIAELSDTAALH